MMEPAQESGNYRCGVFFKLKAGAKIIDRYPLLRLAGRFHELFKEFGNSHIINYYSPLCRLPKRAS